MHTGTISVQTENIFPIIKKFLYSEQEIFLRELVSNAIDATTKLKTLAQKDVFKGELGDLTIQIRLDKDAKTLTISDGINTGRVRSATAGDAATREMDESRAVVA
jgi:molecular chaperone HtpG